MTQAPTIRSSWRVLCCGMLLVLSLAGCSSNRDAIARGLPRPDRGLLFREEADEQVFIWDCYNGKHIVIFRLNAGFYATDYERQEVPCGFKTPKEQSIELTGFPAENLDPATFWGK